MDDFQINGTFPTLITPKKPQPTFQQFVEQLPHHRDVLQALLHKKGAILFRGFPVTSADQFAEVVESLNFGKLVNYIGGDSPRDKVKNKVYTSTETPASMHLPLHQEMSYIRYFPKNIYFWCETPPVARGETIIADAREVYNALDPEVIKRFQEKELTYVSRYYHKDKIMELVNRFARSHKSWPEVFETDKKEDVESICRKNDFDWRWLRKDWIEVRQTRPALLEHPVTKETVWFNQAHLYDFNPKLLGWRNFIASELFYFKRDTKLHEVTFADGSPIRRKDLYHVLDTLEKNTIYYPWQKGDVMILDNVLGMHGRAPFRGKRRVLTALTV